MTDDQIDALDTFALHAMAPRGRQSVRDFARAVLAAASEAAKPVGWMSPIELKNLGIARECNDNRGFIIRPSQLPDYIPTVPLYTAAPTDSQAGRDAVEAAIQRIEAWRDSFIEEHGHTDPSTGALEFGTGAHADRKQEFVGELEEAVQMLKRLAEQQ